MSLFIQKSTVLWVEVCISARLLARTFLLAKWNHNSSKSTYVDCLKQLLKNLILQHFFFFAEPELNLSTLLSMILQVSYQQLSYEN